MKKYWNNQIYYECKLVSIWNAAIYHDISVPIRYGDEYIRDCKMAMATYGSCLRENYVVKKMNLQKTKGKLNWNWIKKNCPAEFSIFCHRGYHSVLSIDINLKNRKVLLANYAKGRLCWINVNKLIKMHNKHVSPIKWSRLRRKLK